MKCPFKAGDKIRCVDASFDTHIITVGEIYTVERLWTDPKSSAFFIKECPDKGRLFMTYQFVAVV
ncbi:MAG TPA: hypothetical protein DHN29_11240 [Cytophagales bacterium]|nr:hypothetical protein [Cytophagales bacterium]|tara:strand:+ start:2427 stop:2621 length:195 start_codon:yes stop_codon:yes gene_type:complete